MVDHHSPGRGGGRHLIEETLGDAHFLIHADPDEVLALASRAEGAEARSAAAVYRTSAGWHRGLKPGARRQVLAVDAARWQAGDLGRRLAEVPDEHGAEAPFRVEWATGTSLDSALLWSAELPGHGKLGPATVRAMAAGGLPGHDVVTVASRGREGWIWDLRSGSCVGRPVFGDGGVHALESVVLDGRRSLVISGYSIVDDLLRASVWVMDLDSGQRAGARIVTGHVSDPLAVTTVEGRPVVISGGSAVRVWDLLEGHPLGTSFEAHLGTRAVSITTTTLDDRPVAIIGDDDGRVHVWDPLAGSKVAASITTSGKPESLLALSLNGRPVVVCGGHDGPVEVRDLRDGTLLRELLPRGILTSGSRSLAYGELGGRPILAAVDRAGRVRVLDAATGEPLCVPLPPGRAKPDAVCVAEADGRVIAVTSGLQSSVVRAWDLTAACASPAAGRPRRLPGEVTGLVVGEVCGREVVVTAHHDACDKDDPGRGEGHLCVIDLADGTFLSPPIPTGTGQIRLALADLDGDPVAVINCNRRSTPRLLRLPGGQVRDGAFSTPHYEQDHHGRITAVATGHLGGRPVVVTGGRSNEARVWFLDDGSLRTAITGRGDEHAGVTAAVIGSLRGRAVAVTAGHGFGAPEIRAWWLSSGRPVCRPETGHSGTVTAIAISALNGVPVVVTGGTDRTVRVWDLDSGQLVRQPFVGHTAPVLALTATEFAGHPVVVSGGEDHTARVWDLDSGRQLRRADLPGAVSHVAAASSDGRLIVAFGDDLAVLAPPRPAASSSSSM
ncbi:WD40 repeat domain-containing protein [Nonomuraea bangladeshensis]|uniref:WD40 repeat domain-containing protein n=1 Tax=Nonomuraea bangladeshensis TaxID=404385 RepID=A0ABV3HE84_9ACTN